MTDNTKKDMQSGPFSDPTVISLAPELENPSYLELGDSKSIDKEKGKQMFDSIQDHLTNKEPFVVFVTCGENCLGGTSYILNKLTGFNKSAQHQSEAKHYVIHLTDGGYPKKIAKLLDVPNLSRSGLAIKGFNVDEVFMDNIKGWTAGTEDVFDMKESIPGTVLYRGIVSGNNKADH